MKVQIHILLILHLVIHSEWLKNVIYMDFGTNDFPSKKKLLFPAFLENIDLKTAPL